MKILKRLSTISGITDLASTKREYWSDISFPTVNGALLFRGNCYTYDSKDKNFVKTIDLNVVSHGQVGFYKSANPIYEKAYDKNNDDETNKQIDEALDKDNRELRDLAEKINKVYEEAGKKVFDILKKAGYQEV
jgi:hypothetical protein